MVCLVIARPGDWELRQRLIKAIFDRMTDDYIGFGLRSRCDFNKKMIQDFLMAYLGSSAINWKKPMSPGNKRGVLGWYINLDKETIRSNN